MEETGVRWNLIFNIADKIILFVNRKQIIDASLTNVSEREKKEIIIINTNMQLGHTVHYH